MVTGIVKEFEPANPHTKIVLEITDEKGTRDVEFEGHSRNNYYRGGWRDGMVKVGDKITLQCRADARRQRRRLRARRHRGRRHEVLERDRARQSASLTIAGRVCMAQASCPNT